MRVLHVLNGSSGGSIVAAIELVKASRAMANGVEHCAVYPGRPGSEDIEIQRVFHQARPIPLRSWNKPKNLDPLRRLLLFALSQRASGLGLKTARAFDRAIVDWSIDLVTTNCAVNLHGALAARRAGIPHVWHMRERVGTGGSMQFRLDDRRLVQRIARLSTRIAAVSEYVAEPFRKHGADGHLEVVYDGVDVPVFRSSGAKERGRDLRRQWGIPDEVVLVGMVANVTAHVKRHALFLSACARVMQHSSNVRFVVVGALPQDTGWFNKASSERWHRLDSLARDLSLEGKLVWTGFVDDPPAVMNAIDVMAHACEIEGFPRVVLEAMAAGKPVVAPAAGGIPEGVGDAGILVEEDSAEELADGIEVLVTNKNAKERLVGIGFRRVVARFDIGRHAKVMLNLYKEACGRRTSGMARAKTTVDGMSLGSSVRKPPLTRAQPQ